MNYYHKADHTLAKWIDDIIEDKITKKASSVNTVFMPYGDSERATQLKGSVIDAAIEEMQDDTSDLEKKIDEAKTPEELAALEKQLSGDDSSTEDSTTGAPAADAPPAEDSTSDAATTTAPTSAPAPATTTPNPEVDALKKEMEGLKKEIESLSGEEKMQKEIDLIKRRLEGFDVQDNPDLNSSINQSASKIKWAKRAIRRLMERKAANDKAYYKVDMAKVKKYDSNAPYLRLVQKEIKNGDGLVQIYDESGNNAQIYAADSHSFLLGAVTVPKDALTKVKDASKNIEAKKKDVKPVEGEYGSITILKQMKKDGVIENIMEDNKIDFDEVVKSINLSFRKVKQGNAFIFSTKHEMLNGDSYELKYPADWEQPEPIAKPSMVIPLVKAA